MRRWYTADTHFGHTNIIKYCNRPFRDTSHMDTVLMNNWNSVVNPDDEVYVLGDIILGNFLAGIEKCKQLNGQKFMVPGNHDRNHDGLGQVEKDSIYESAGFTVLPGITRLPLGDTTILASHFPYVGDSHDGDRYTKYRPKDEGEPIIHGHVHDSWQSRGKMLNVGVDVWDFTPVHEQTILSWVHLVDLVLSPAVR